jgi:hypothetical protein
MKVFLKNLFGFGLLVLILQQISFIFVSPFWGNDVLDSKYAYLLEKDKDINTLFIGSSRVNRGVNPKIIDSLLTEYQVRSYNFGSPSTTNPETYFITEQILRTENLNLDYLFVELTPLISIKVTPFKYYQSRYYYWINLRYSWFIAKYLLNANYAFADKFEIGASYIKCFIMKNANFLHYKKLFDFSNETKLKNFFLKGNNGFYPLDDQRPPTAKYAKRTENFQNDTSGFNKMTSKVQQEFKSNKIPDAFNSAHYQKLMQLIELAKAKNIHLIYLLPPRSRSYEEELSLIRQIPSEHIIEVANPFKFPELYQSKYAFDKNHFNKEGADIFTHYIVDEFKAMHYNN